MSGWDSTRARRTLQFRHKVLLLPALAAIGFSILVIAGIVLGGNSATSLKNVERGYVPARAASRELESILGEIQRTLQDAVASADVEGLGRSDALRDKFVALANEEKANPIREPLEITMLVDSFEAYYDLARDTTTQLITAATIDEEEEEEEEEEAGSEDADFDDGGEDLVAQIGQMSASYNQIKEELQVSTKRDTERMNASFATAHANNSLALRVNTIVAVCCLVILFFLSLWIIRGVLTTLSVVSRGFERMKAGDVSEVITVSSQDELGELSVRLNEMRDYLLGMTETASAIAGGDLDVEVTLLSDKDRFGAAFAEMVHQLREASEQNSQERWLKVAQTELSDKMRGDLPLPELGENIISFLAEYLDAQVGTFYAINDKTEAAQLKASYAFTHRKQANREFQSGEGLIGQAILEKKFMVVTEVPETYMTVASGLGNTSPSNLLIAPLVLAGTAKGALELGSFTPFSDQKITLLKSVAENIAIAITSAQDRARMQTLLATTQQQAEDLRTQEEELKASNEELSEQTQTLRASEEELKSQREELRASNEELAQKTEYLENQKSEIQQKNAEVELARKDIQRTANELEQASKYKSEFLANMSHELRTPLNSLLILSKSLASNEDGNLTPEQQESASIIHSGGHDLLTLINDILDLSKVEAGKLNINCDEMKFDPLIGHLKRQFSPVARERDLELVMERDEDLPAFVETDTQRVEQILKNLLSNALKFTERGTVTLRISSAVEGTKFRSGLTAKDTVCFAVSDTGIGIPSEKQTAIFEAFQQADGSTSRLYGGTGLGLTISRELSKLLKGEIQIESVEGKGSTFRLYLPMTIDPESATVQDVEVLPAVVPNSSPQRPNNLSRPKITLRRQERTMPSDDRDDIQPGDRTVLIIEDEPNFAKVLLQFSRARGYKAVITDRGAVGIELASQIVPTVIVLDIGLPDIGGLNVLEQLKYDLRTRHIPVHVISGGNHGGAAMEKGAFGFLFKPATSEGLADAFAKIEDLLKSNLRSVLLVEDDATERSAMKKLLSGQEIEITEASSGQQAIDALRAGQFDCVVLDLELPDMTGLDVLRKVTDGQTTQLPPVIIHTGRDLDRDEHSSLRGFTTSIVIKGPNSPERLLDELSLFLHSVESSLPESQRKIIQMLHDPEQVLVDRKILLVDDDLRNTFALSSVLKRHGLQVIIADNGQLALEKLAKESGIELVIMDIMMPVMDGYEAIKEIRSNKRFENLPIITLTAKAMPEDRQKSMEAGANDYLTKPVDIDKLLSLLRVWLFEAR